MMKNDLLIEIKNKRFIATSKNFKYFDILYELKAEGLIENKSKNEYRLTKKGYKAADMEYDKYIQSLEILSNQSLNQRAETTTKNKNPNSQRKLNKGLIWFWKLISENALISTIIVAIIFYIIKLLLNIDLK